MHKQANELGWSRYSDVTATDACKALHPSSPKHRNLELHNRSVTEAILGAIECNTLLEVMWRLSENRKQGICSERAITEDAVDWKAV